MKNVCHLHLLRGEENIRKNLIRNKWFCFLSSQLLCVRCDRCPEDLLLNSPHPSVFGNILSIPPPWGQGSEFQNMTTASLKH